MSNIVTQLKKRPQREKARIEEREFTEAARNQMLVKNQGSGQQGIKIATLALPNTLYVDVKTGDIKFGVEEVPISAVEPSHTFDQTDPNFQALYEYVELCGGDSISKVIMDNHEHFKVLSVEEFLTNMKAAEAQYVAKQQEHVPEEGSD